MCDLLAILKPHFFPYFSCFQYGADGCSLWLAKRCIQFIVITDRIRDYNRLLDAKEQLDLPSLVPYLAPPDEYRDAILRFPHDYFDLIIVHSAPLDFAQVFPDVLVRLKSSGIIVLASGHVLDYLVDYEEIGEGVYRKPQ